MGEAEVAFTLLEGLIGKLSQRISHGGFGYDRSSEFTILINVTQRFSTGKGGMVETYYSHAIDFSAIDREVLSKQ